MSLNVNLKDKIMDDKQAEQFAISIFEDIEEYIKNNETEYLGWLDDIDVDLLNNVIVSTDKTKIRIPNNVYKLCEYK